MATAEAVESALDTGGNGLGAQINVSLVGASLTSYYVVGLILAPGRSRWVTCNTADSAATQAAAILVALRA